MVQHGVRIQDDDFGAANSHYVAAGGILWTTVGYEYGDSPGWGDEAAEGNEETHDEVDSAADDGEDDRHGRRSLRHPNER